LAFANHPLVRKKLLDCEQGKTGMLRDEESFNDAQIVSIPVKRGARQEIIKNVPKEESRQGEPIDRATALDLISSAN
jgi:hypothetical protein